METKTKESRTICTDSLVTKIFCGLRSDFSAFFGAPEFQIEAEKALMESPISFRKHSFPKDWYAEPVMHLKARTQLKSLFKEYRFKRDLYTDAELEQLSLQKYLAHQEVLQAAELNHPLSKKVLVEAKKILVSVLGSYDPEQTISLSRFGTKSSVGCPRALAYLDNKLSNAKAFTSSARCADWFFEDYLPNDSILQELLLELSSDGWHETLAHESLDLVFVPKSWKALRIITPLTLLSLFYSFGVGEQITRALTSVGINLSSQQSLHRRVIRRFSLTRSHVTADLSSASDSITEELLSHLLPDDWYEPIMRCLTSRYTHKGEAIVSASVAPMGNGLTFPLETLVFYVITKAIGNLCGCKGLFSVYGDDLIYPAKAHRFVKVIFPMLGFKLNLEKTFEQEPFRESCGSDFYRGVDVRPFHVKQWEGGASRTQYLAWLYKAINGLLARWDISIIPRTISLLLDEVVRTNGEIFQVPPSFPETSGVRVSTPGALTQIHMWSPVHVHASGTVNPSSWVSFRTRVAQGFSFKYLASTSQRREVVCQKPFYWDCMRAGSLARIEDYPRGLPWWGHLFPTDAPETILVEYHLDKRWYQDKSGKRRLKKVKRRKDYVSAHENPIYSCEVFPDNPGKQQTMLSVWA